MFKNSFFKLKSSFSKSIASFSKKGAITSTLIKLAWKKKMNCSDIQTDYWLFTVSEFWAVSLKKVDKGREGKMREH